MFDICSKLTIKTLERQRRSVCIVGFEQASNIFLVFPLLFWTNKCRLAKTHNQKILTATSDCLANQIFWVFVFRKVRILHNLAKIYANMHNLNNFAINFAI